MKSIKNIRELEKELREWILMTMLAEFYTLTKLGKVQISLLRKTNKHFSQIRKVTCTCLL